MAPAAMKRPAASVPASRPSKKAATVSKAPAMCKAVSEALNSSELPRDVKKMLAESVPRCLGIPSDARHEFQSTLVTMIGEAMHGIRDVLEKDKAALMVKVESTESEKAARDAAEAAAVTNLTSKTILVSERRSASGAHAAALAEAKQILKEAESSQKSGDELIAPMIAQKDALEAAQAKLVAMKAAAGSPADIKKVVAVASGAGCDQNLVITMSAVYMKEPAARGTFDEMAAEQSEKFFIEALARVGETLAESEVSKAARAAAVVEARAGVDVASEKVTTGTAALTEALEAEKDAEKALKAAKAAVKSFTSDVKAIAKEFKFAAQAFSEFTAGPLTAFETLRDPAIPAVTEAAHAEQDQPTLEVAEETAPVTGESAPVE